MDFAGEGSGKPNKCAVYTDEEAYELNPLPLKLE